METMANETTVNREIRERLSRCVSTMVYFQVDRKSWTAAKLLHEEADSLLKWAVRFAPGEALRTSILDPLERELIERYGDEEGARLHGELIQALGSLASRAGIDSPDPVLSDD